MKNVSDGQSCQSSQEAPCLIAKTSPGRRRPRFSSSIFNCQRACPHPLQVLQPIGTLSRRLNLALTKFSRQKTDTPETAPPTFRSVAAIPAASVSGGCSHPVPPCQRIFQTFFEEKFRTEIRGFFHGKNADPRTAAST